MGTISTPRPAQDSRPTPTEKRDRDEQRRQQLAAAHEQLRHGVARLIEGEQWQVFDISQTDGQPLPDLTPGFLDGDVPTRLWHALVTQVTDQGFVLLRDDAQTPGANGEMNRGAATVRVRPALTQAQASKTLAHELAHIVLGHGTPECTDPRSRCEVEAESVAYVVMTAAGLDTSTYSFPYIAGWADGDLDVLAQTADQVIRAARQVIEHLPAADPA
jgi:hypothetical protein